MPQIKLCFLWHMHQPLYKDLVTGAYRLPWTRLHALKDYYGMVKILDEFPKIHQTFNLVPSLVRQIEDYARGNASDRFLDLALTPPEDLDREEKEFILRYFFQANQERVISRYPRYEELFGILQRNGGKAEMAAPSFDVGMLRDLQVLSQLAWFDEEYLTHDPESKALAQKGRNFSPDDQILVGRKQTQMLSKVLGVYKEFSDREQIELSTSPFYHPILPLLCDSNIAGVSHPYVPLPSQFAYPGDAEDQLSRAYHFMEQRFGKAPLGLWPSEGSVSDQTFDIAARLGFHWVASDDGVLARTLGTSVSPLNTYRAYSWRESLKVVFRDHNLSDLIGFVYAQMDSTDAAKHFLAEVRKNCQPVLQAGGDALVPIILDGENAWETYVENGRPFLRKLYQLISDSPDMRALSMSEALNALPAKPLTHVYPGSWINSTFDIWIGAAEDNRAWEQLLTARKMYDTVVSSAAGGSIPPADRELAWEELLIAEGSDWCWWYGPEHSSANRVEFDELYRDHLANVYRLLKQDIPADLGESILQERETETHTAPNGLIQPVIDGIVTSKNEWENAGRYRLECLPGAMHSQHSPLQELQYGSDEKNIYLRVDFFDAAADRSALSLRFVFRNSAGERFTFQKTGNAEAAASTSLSPGSVNAAIAQICELRVSMNALHVRPGEKLFVHLSAFRQSLPVASLPLHGELELKPTALAAAF